MTRLPGPGSLANVIIVNKLLDVSQLLVEIMKVGSGLLVLLVLLVLLILRLDSCLDIPEFFAAFRCVIELTLKTCEPLTDLVQNIVKLSIHVIVLVELRLVFDPLFSRHYGCIGRYKVQVSIWSQLQSWPRCLVWGLCPSWSWSRALLLVLAPPAPVRGAVVLHPARVV